MRFVRQDAFALWEGLVAGWRQTQDQRGAALWTELVVGLERGQQKQLQYVFGEAGIVLGLRVVGSVVKFWHCRKTEWMIAL